MIFIQDLFCFIQIEIVFTFCIPRKFQHRFDVTAAYSRLCRRWLHLGKTADLLLDFFSGLVFQLQFFQLCAESFDFIFNVFCNTQFILDRPHLLPQVIFSLILIDLRFHLGIDILFDIEDLDLFQQDRIEFFKTFLRIQYLKQCLLVLQLAFQMGCDHICHSSRLIDGNDRSKYFRCQTLVDTDIVIETGQYSPHKSFCFRIIFLYRLVLDSSHSAAKIRYFEEDIFDASSAYAFYQYANGIPRQLEHLLDFTDGPDMIKIIRCRKIRFIILLRCQENMLIHDHRLLQSIDRLLPSDIKMKHHVREYRKPAQRYHRKIHHFAFFCKSRRFKLFCFCFYFCFRFRRLLFFHFIYFIWIDHFLCFLIHVICLLNLSRLQGDIDMPPGTPYIYNKATKKPP